MKLSYTWNKGRGEYEYILTEPNGKKYTGDLYWAQKTARHFKLKLPKVPEV